MRANDPREVLVERVDKNGGPDACWPWTWALSPRGYGRVRVQGRDWRAHRLAYVIWVGPIDDGIVVCHHCDNPTCCNPAHLFAGTHLDNQRDKWAKGRGRINPYERTSEHRAALSARSVRQAQARDTASGRFVRSPEAAA